MPAKAGMTVESAWMKRPCVYILASKRNGTLYVGMTSDLSRRFDVHKSDAVDGFTKVWRAPARVRRVPWDHGRRNRAREAAQEMAPGLEGRVDPARQSGVARSVRQA